MGRGAIVVMTALPFARVVRTCGTSAGPPSPRARARRAESAPCSPCASRTAIVAHPGGEGNPERWGGSGRGDPRGEVHRDTAGGIRVGDRPGLVVQQAGGEPASDLPV